MVGFANSYAKFKINDNKKPVINHKKGKENKDKKIKVNKRYFSSNKRRRKTELYKNYQ